MNNTEQGELFFFLKFMKDDERSSFLTISRFWKIFIGSFTILVFVFGTLMKCIVYSYFGKKQRLLERPINILILLEQMFSHFINSYSILFLLLRVFTDKTPVMFWEKYFNILVNKEKW